MDKDKLKKEGLNLEGFEFKVSEDELMFFWDEIPTEENLKKFKEVWPQVKSRLIEEGIFGVLEEPEVLNNRLVVAKGVPITPFVPEKIELLEKFAKVISFQDEPVDLQDKEERKDIREIHRKIVCAEENEIIGKWYPPIPGLDGVNVFGETLQAPQPSSQSQIRLGENLFIDEEKSIRAKQSGVVIYHQNTIDIFPEYEIKGDVDFSVGNIDFIGKKLIIKGDVKFGFKVKAKGDLEIYGGTENKVLIEVEGNFLCDGIIRGEETKVKVKGKAEIKGVEHAKLEVLGDLVVKNYLIFSETFVSGKIEANAGKGIIYGGVVKACDVIEAKILGNETHTSTKILAGYQPELIDDYLRKIQQSILLEETLNKLKVGIELGERLKKEKNLTPEKQKILEKIQKQYELYSKELEELLQQLKIIKKELSLYQSKFIKAQEKVYPGVMVGIADVFYTVVEEIPGPIIFSLENGKINIQKS
ncbi:FapA family protein [Thermodesulfobacterium commune]|uniref:FapA family protein n=1 Tax=Thermodesulfobacterium commune TaxID=1741 RepID=UPI002FDA8302